MNDGKVSHLITETYGWNNFEHIRCAFRPEITTDRQQSMLLTSTTTHK